MDEQRSQVPFCTALKLSTWKLILLETDALKLIFDIPIWFDAKKNCGAQAPNSQNICLMILNHDTQTYLFRGTNGSLVPLILKWSQSPCSIPGGIDFAKIGGWNVPSNLARPAIHYFSLGNFRDGKGSSQNQLRHCQIWKRCNFEKDMNHGSLMSRLCMCLADPFISLLILLLESTEMYGIFAC